VAWLLDAPLLCFAHCPFKQRLSVSLSILSICQSQVFSPTKNTTTHTEYTFFIENICCLACLPFRFDCRIFLDNKFRLVQVSLYYSPSSFYEESHVFFLLRTCQRRFRNLPRHSSLFILITRSSDSATTTATVTFLHPHFISFPVRLP